MFSGTPIGGTSVPASRARRAPALGALAAALFASACRGGPEYPQTTFHPVSEYGADLNSVFYNTFWWTMPVLMVVCVLIVYAVVRFRERPGTPHPEQIHGSTILEIGWTIVPALIVVAIAIPTVRTIFATQRMPDDANVLTIEVIGHQWWWEFRYPQYGIVTANHFYVPTDRNVTLRMHSADVVHSFWIPRFGGKRDVNPLPRTAEPQENPHNMNMIHFAVNEPGLYYGQCAEFCGEAHGIMLVSAQAVPPAEFERWVVSMADAPAELEAPGPAVGVAPADPAPGDPPAADAPAAPAAPPADTAADAAQADTTAAAAQTVAAQQPAARPVRPAMPVPTGIGQRVEPPLSGDELAEEGRDIFMRSTCIACHAISNTTARGLLGPSLTRFGARPTVGAGAARNTQENVEAWIISPHALKPGTLMPGTRTGGGGMPATNLTDDEVRAVAAYLLSLR
jgi:cytochrome c oxidase subunit II